MKTLLIAGTGLGLLMGGVALAQVPGAPVSPPPPAVEGAPSQEGPGHDGPREGWHHGHEHGYEHGHGHGWRHGRMAEMMRMQMQGPAGAHFRFRKGDAVVDIKCAEDEPMKACVEAGTALLDKIASQAR